MSPRFPRLAPALLLLVAAPAAFAQTAAASAAAPPTTAASAAPVNDEAAQERIMTLVRQRKCTAAKTEATRVGDLSLADQIETMCGAHSSNPFPTHGGGGGGGGGAGRRAGGGGPGGQP